MKMLKKKINQKEVDLHFVITKNLTFPKFIPQNVLKFPIHENLSHKILRNVAFTEIYPIKVVWGGVGEVVRGTKPKMFFLFWCRFVANLFYFQTV